MAESTAKVENVKLGDFIQLGRYTLMVCSLCELMILCQLGNMLFMMFAGAAPIVKSYADVDLTNFTHSIDSCREFEKLKLENDSFDAEIDYQFKSVNVEWKYYCNDAQQVKTSISIQMIGVMFGSVIFGQFSDSFGRKKAMIVNLAGSMIFMMLSAFSYDLLTFTITRFIVNFFTGGQISVMLMYSVENLPKKDRLWINSIVSWAPNYLIFSGVAYMAKDWRNLAIYSSILTLPALILCCFMSESAQFLIHKGKIDDAEKIIERMCKIDGRKCDSTLLKQVLNKEKELFEASLTKSKKYSYWHLFSSWKLAKYTIAVSASFFITSIVNYGLVFNMEKLTGSIYINTVFIGLFRYVLNLSVAFLDFNYNWLGRKRIHLAAWFEIIFALIVIFVIYLTCSEKSYSLIIRCSTVSIISLSAQLYISNGIVTGELFPTCIRTIAYSFAQFNSRLGVVFAPQLFQFTNLWIPLPYLVLIILALFDMLFFHWSVPETKGQPLVENMPTKKRIPSLIFNDPKNDELEELTNV